MQEQLTKIETIQPCLHMATYAIEQAVRVFGIPEADDQDNGYVEMMKHEARSRLTFEDYQYWMELVRIRDALKAIQ